MTSELREENMAAHNITYTQAGVLCFVGQEKDKFKVQYFVASSVVKILACLSLRTFERHTDADSEF